MSLPNASAAPNRLALATSPYLLQHARNPVDWFPWGQAAFEEARRADKPLFLSIGYSTCHWCHVMARESFEDPGTARLLNRHFVCVKVDREERPDIDRLYMTYVQALTRGGGGWPLSVWLTPDLKPFFGGTYFPPEERYGQPAFARVLEALAEAWRDARERIEAAAEEALDRLRPRDAAAGAAADAVPAAAALEAAERALLASYDPADGGFGGPPKFPRPSALLFLLRRPARAGGNAARDAAVRTLRAMADGGLRDHLGGGFHRYATDARWLIPHFEKMLYDQAQLACAYLEAYQLTGDAALAEVARDTLAYVRRDLTGPDGACYAAEDADSPATGAAGEAAEGAFYTWTPAEVRDALGDADGRRFCAAFGLDRADTAVDGRHVPAVSRADARELLARHRDALLAARGRRPRPARDEKAVTAWNGLAISAFARAYQILEDPEALAAAQRAAEFARDRLADPATGRLARCWCRGAAAADACAEDYACLVQGLLDLYEADFDTGWLAWALALQERLDALFWDAPAGGYFASAADAADVPLRLKESYDGAEPAAGSVAACNLLRLAAITGDGRLAGRADEVFRCAARQLRMQPKSAPHLLAAVGFRLAGPDRIVVAGRRDAPDTRALLRAARRPFLPHRVLLLADGGAGQAYLAGLNPPLAELRPLDGRAAAYVCRGNACLAPVTAPEELLRLLERAAP